MTQMENSCNLNKIRAAVSERDMKIWENDAYSACVQKEKEKLKIEMERLDKEIEEMEKEDAILEEQLAAAMKSLEIQKQTLYTSEQSLIMQQTLKENPIEPATEWRIKYAETLEEYDNEYKDYRVRYESRCKSYKDLQFREIELKKEKFESMDLEAKIKNTKKIMKQFIDIQDQISHTIMVKFANCYMLHRKNEETEKLLVELKREEQRLRNEHFELNEKVKKLKEKNLVTIKKHLKLSEEMPSVTSEKSSREYKVQPKEDLMKKFLSEEIATFSLTSLEPTPQHPEYINNDASKMQPKEDLMKKFLNEEIATVALTSLETTTQHSTFINNDTSKVRILADVKVVKPQVKKTSVVQKSTEELRRKMQHIMENTKKNASRSSTPANSQQSQESQSKAASNFTKVSQTMSALNHKEKMVNPILKPKNVSQNVDPEENTKKDACRSFTLATPVNLQQSQESQSKVASNSTKVSQTASTSNQKAEMINPILKQKNVSQKVDPETTSKFFKTKSVTFQTGYKNEQEEKPSQENKRIKLNPKTEKKMTISDENKFQFDDKENKSVAAMNIFRKPFNLKKEVPKNQGEKKEGNSFLQNISFGFFDNNKQSLATESDIGTNMTSASFAGASFGSYGTENVYQQSSGEELNDPMEFSFTEAPQSPAGPINFEQPPGPAMFRFGSQNNNNLFNLF